jgi:hypothetical protein
MLSTTVREAPSVFLSKHACRHAACCMAASETTAAWTSGTGMHARATMSAREMGETAASEQAGACMHACRVECGWCGSEGVEGRHVHAW